MIKKYFQVVCDYCKCNIRDYPKKSPTNKELREDKIVIYNRKHFCNDECKRWFKKGKGAICT